MQINPYEAPKAPIVEGPVGDQGAPQIASGQKLVIYAILLNLATIGLRPLVGQLVLLVALAAGGMSVVGIVRIGAGMGFSTPSKIFLVVATFIPVINLVTLLILNARATARLRRAGYRVGLLGATK